MMKHDIARRRTDSVLAPDHLSVAKPLRPEDLDRCVTQHGIYPSLPASPGVPWSAYVRSQRKGSRSVSSSTEALDSDQARCVTQRIIQHARSYLLIHQSLMFHQQIESIGQKVDLVIDIHPECILQQVCADHLMMIMQQDVMTMLLWEE